MDTHPIGNGITMPDGTIMPWGVLRDSYPLVKIYPTDDNSESYIVNAPCSNDIQYKFHSNGFYYIGIHRTISK